MKHGFEVLLLALFTGITGLAEAFAPSARWERYEFVFRATSDLEAAASRLQFWFQGAGTLWR